MDAADVMLLLIGGLVAGTVNTMAGGGSLLTVPLLILAGVPGNVANGSNRVGILASTVTATVSFRRLGVSGVSRMLPVLLPVVAGSLTGSILISRLADETFESAFGILMVPLLLLALRSPKVPHAAEGTTAWTMSTTAGVFFFVGCYGGAFQVGIGLLLVLALSRSGLDLVAANSIKVLVILVVSLTALPVFIAGGHVDWGPALVLALGFAAGGAVGARITVGGGERVVRPVLIMAVLGLAGRLLGLW